MIKARAALRRWFWLLLVGLLVGAVAGAASLRLRPEQDPGFQATSVVLFDLERSSSAAQQAAQQAGLQLQRGAVPLRAAQLLDEDDPEALVERITVEVDGDSLSLRIRAISDDAKEATAITEAFTDAFLESTNAEELANLDNQIELLERRAASAQARLDEFDRENPLARTLTDPDIPVVRERADLIDAVLTVTEELDETVQRRDTTTGPYSRLGPSTVKVASTSVLALPGSPLVRVGLLGALGLGLAIMLVALIERWNPRIDSKEESEEATGLPVLSMVPYLGWRSRPRTDHVDPSHFGGGHAESYRRLRSAVQYVSGKSGDRDGRGQSFLVVSASPGEGKTSTVAFTAFALAEADVPTLAVNADARRPTLHQRLGGQPEPGLAQLAEYRVDRPHLDDVVQPGPIDDLWVLASGKPGPLTTEMVHAVTEVIEIATRRGATVVIDSSPLLATADVMELIPLVDHVVFVIRNGRTTRREADEALEMLRLREAPLLGCVCVGSRASKRRYSYYENYYLASSTKSQEPDPPATTPPTPTPTGVGHLTPQQPPPRPVAAQPAPVAAHGAPPPPPYRAPGVPERS